MSLLYRIAFVAVIIWVSLLEDRIGEARLTKISEKTSDDNIKKKVGKNCYDEKGGNHTNGVQDDSWRIVWDTWSACSVSCGGGTRSRNGFWWAYCNGIPSSNHGDVKCLNHPETEHRSCEETCMKGDYDSGCKCYDRDGQVSPYPIYYGYCCDIDCPRIKWCNKYWCNDPSTTCTECDAVAGADDYTTSAYWLNNNECIPRCNWLDHWCWPGTCDTTNQYLASTCTCMDGFVKETPDAMTTKCKLTHTPMIETCRLGFEGTGGEDFNSTFVGNTTSCSNTRDTFVNVPPKELHFTFEFSFELPKDPPDKHSYVHDYHFGIVDGDVILRYYSKTGDPAQDLFLMDMPSDADCTVASFDPANPADGLITCRREHNYTYVSPQDGDMLCHDFQAAGSGFVRIKDGVTQAISSKHRYTQTTTDAEKCFRFDFTSTDHCKNLSPPCADDPLDIGPRVQRHPSISAMYHGHYDPYPNSAVTGPSGIEKYKILIHKVQINNDTQQVDFGVDAEYNSSAATETFDFELPDIGNPMLYAVYLHTLDLAKNFRMTRRFVLFDNSSSLALDNTNPLNPISANRDTGYLWQVSLDPIIVDWQEHFFNDWFIHSNHLKPIKADPNVVGIFEQTDEPLPVTGTPNVHGITSFMYNYSKTSPTSNVSAPYREIPVVTDQQVTLIDLTLEDGDTVDINVLAIDINGNRIEDGFRMLIDSTPPVLENLWLTKDGYKQLYVHNSKDLADMDFVFQALDPHSGLKTVKWRLGTTPKGSDIGSGALPVVRPNVTCSDPNRCSCPIIGRCSLIDFAIDLKKLIGASTDVGDHNREYHFWVEVLNEAHLTTIEEITVLVDDSPPEPGVIINGPAGGMGRTYQSDELLQWHWRSFIDHESGISKYHYAVGRRCFTTDDLHFLADLANDSRVLDFGETTNQHADYVTDEEGKFHLNVIAFNAAMDPSLAVCSDRLLVDTTAPVLKHIHFHTARTQPAILCSSNYSIWHLTDTAIATPLLYQPACERHCQQPPVNISLFYQDFKLSNNGSMILPPADVSTSLCSLLPTYQPGDQMLFVPTDNMELTWESDEPESQIHDFYVGVSSSRENIDMPDIIDYKSTTRRSQYKCVHCGLGEGQMFVIQLKATNKAGLSNVVSIGPVIIDLTPPVYDTGMDLHLTDGIFWLSWTASSFYDAEDSNLLTRYQWALGTASDPQCVEGWHWMVVPHDHVDDSYIFRVEYPAEKLHDYDQDHGREYIFSVKAYNRAGLSVVSSTVPYQMHSRTVPSKGRVIHVPQSNIHEESVDEIGFQVDDTVICVKWTGFYHYKDELKMNISLGTTRGLDDVVSDLAIENKGSYCFTSLALVHLQKYFVTLNAFNTLGSVKVSSHGIFISGVSETLQHARVDEGLDCDLSFTVLETNVQLLPGEQTELIVMEEKLSYIFYTLALEHEWLGNFDVFEVSASSRLLQPYSWRFFNDSCTQYFKIPIMQHNQSVLISSKSDLKLHIISVSPCIKDQRVQASTQGLRSAWTFRPEVLTALSHYTVSVHEFYCTPASCQDGGEIVPETTAGVSSINTHLSLHPSHSYQTSVAPCFGNTCIDPVSSGGVVIDPSPAISSYLACTIKPQYRILKDTLFLINATWKVFLNADGLRDSASTVYDWSVSSTPIGGAMLMPWKRVAMEDVNSVLKVSAESELHVHSNKTVYLRVRSYNDWHVQSVESVACKLEDALPPLAAPVYDLPLNYPPLNSLNDVLHSNQLGEVGNKLHNDEVDWSSNIRGISGALQGTACSDHEWFVQEDPEINCKTSIGHHQCIKRRYTSKNVVEFRNMHLEHGHRYFICVHAWNGTCSPEPMKMCSNGFIVDTAPPGAGRVTVGHGDQVSAGLQDNSSVVIRWEGFTDIQFPDVMGINEYYYAIGISPGNDDTVQFRAAGMAQHVTATNISLQSGVSYYVSVKACDHMGQCSIASTLPVLVDSTPPNPGKVSVHFATHLSSHSSPHDVLVRWRDFEDGESGVSGYELGVGSRPGSQDVSAFRPVTGVSYMYTGEDSMHDGQYYFFQIKAINGVGLWSIVSSIAVLYDASRPVTGYVRFGEPGEENSLYTTDVSRVAAHWGGFSDPNSGIMYYRFCIGSKAGQSNVWGWEDTGLHTAIIKSLDLDPGMEYYVTVEACNSVMLCSRVTAGPLIPDNSPPMPGVVNVAGAATDEHSMYTSSRSTLVATWLNFHDPQSGILRYDWCIGLSPNQCDVHGLTTAHQSVTQYMTGLQLPVNTPLYVSVIATNNAGMQVRAHSSQFVVDDSPPLVITAPLLLSPSLELHTQYDRSLLSLRWLFQDDESPVWTHAVSLHTLHSAIQGPVDHLLVGDVQHVSIPLPVDQLLEDGVRYVASVTACNGAGVCTTAESPSFLVDSSPPHLGGFVEPLAWENNGAGGSNVALSWEGFDDAHSGIRQYHIKVSSTYNGADLSGGVLHSPHNDSTSLQTASFNLIHEVTPYTMVYLSIWAENGAGLLSDAAKVGVFALKSSSQAGRLDIEKHSCDVHYCNRACTCAVVNKPCETGEQIHDCYNTTGDYIHVADGPQGAATNISASTKCLRAHWQVTDISKPISRFEWTIGAKGSEPGLPIFDIIHEKYWFDVELHTNWVYCLPGTKTLTQGLNYVYYIKAWHGFDEYSSYSSDGSIIDATPPRIGMGRAVRDMDADFEHNIDFTKDNSSLHADWTKVFSDTETGIARYEVSVGTTPGGNEIYGPMTVDTGTTTLSLMNVTLTPGMRYYTTVHAYNHLGLVTSSSSDGVVVDLAPPLPGVVFSSLTFKDAAHHVGEISASWHGFEDVHSFIKFYEWAIGEEGDQVDTLKFHVVGLETSVVIPQTSVLINDGATYRMTVRATDAAGYVSPTVSSSLVIMDSSPPVCLNCTDFVEMPGNWNLSCEACNSSDCSQDYQVCHTQSELHITEHQFIRWILSSSHAHEELVARVQVGAIWDWVQFERKGPGSYSHYTNVLTKDTEVIIPKLYLFKGELRGISSKIYVCEHPEATDTSLIVQQAGAVGLHLHWAVADPHSGIQSVKVVLGSNDGGYQLLPLTDVAHTSSLLVPVPLQHGMVVHALLVAENRAGLSSVFHAPEPLVIVDWTAPLIDDLHVDILLHTVSHTITCTVNATWTVMDAETDIQDCHWWIGTSSGSSDRLPRSRTVQLGSAWAHDITVEHGQSVHVTVLCTNAIDLSSTVHSDGFLVVARAPDAEQARAAFLPQSSTVFPAREVTQAQGHVLELAFQGFTDNAGITGYEYRVSGSGGEWTSAGLADHLLMDDAATGDGGVDISVRALNAGGYSSQAVSAAGRVDRTDPKPNVDGSVRATLNAKALKLDWRGVFTWKAQGQLLFVVYLGTEVGSANMRTGVETFEEELAVTSLRWESPGEAYVVITAVAPSGLFVTHRETVYY